MGTAIDLSEIKRYEVTEVYSDPDATVDIVLVHGLNGHPHKTWTSQPSSKSKKEVFWPTDLLPATLKSAKARILVYGYNADVYAFGGSASSDMIHNHAQTLLANLSAERKLEERLDVPIIWVAHSLGGILVKRALTLSYDLSFKSSHEKHSIYVTTYGIIFLGTPHMGADAAKWGHILQSIGDALIPKKVMDSEPHLVRTLKANNETLQNINLHFLDICGRFEMNMVHEAVKTDLKGTKAFIVDKASASPELPNVTYYGIEADHSHMCKFESKNSPGYTNVSGAIKSWITDSPKLIKERVEVDRESQIRKAEGMVREILGGLPPGVSRDPEGTAVAQSMARLGANEVFSPSNEALITQSMVQSIASIEPEKEISPFIIPPGFRPNSLFVGHQTQLNELHKALFDKKRRAEGTSACLLHSIPGGGKSQLARQYFYSHIDDFPGGVFWVNATSQQQIALGFWDIYKRAVMNRKDAAFSPSHTVNDLSAIQNPHEFIEIVTEWFRQTHEWLLVLDGIHFSNAEAIQRFIPDSVNSSLIYTSTERSVSGSEKFMNPQVITVPPLSAVEAQQLFLQELEKKNPSKDDLKHSMELVQMMGFNPLVIHTVAQRLKRTRETLAKFTRSYAQGPILRGLDTYKAVVDELKKCNAFEALNLIQILCFFGQHIPVEMISLGLNSLDVRVKATEPDMGTSLNNTFMVLNSFALIDRNEAEESVSSQSSQTSKTIHCDNIDMLRIHSVVQDFFVDSLRASGELPHWLARAIKLFCTSYGRADSHIKARGTQGLVEDYRRFHIHAVRLLEHVNRSEKTTRFDSEIKGRLITTLQSLQEEIEGRTPASSQQIARGKPEAYQVSIFDRTSSSSDTGPETPGKSAGLSTSMWGFERETYHSPSSITHEASHMTTRSDFSRSSFPPLPIEDRGYDTDDDLDMSESNTVRGDSTGPWQTVPRRQGDRRKPKPAKLLHHRTIREMDRGRYRDSVGAWRSIATDPRVRSVAAHGTFPSQSRERSSAEDALSTITAKSPPPIRGGGALSTRSGGSEPRNMMQMPTYAAAAAGRTTTSISPTHIFLGESEQKHSNEGLPVRPGTSAAFKSLQRLPTLKTIRQQNQTDDHESRSKDPLPPRFAYQLPYPPSDESLEADQNPKQQSWINPPTYGRNTNPLPFERIDPSPTLGPRKRSLLQDYPSWHAQSYPETTSSSPGPSFSGFASPYLPAWSPGVERSSFDNKRQREPEYLNQYGHHESGYTSQPMSRDPSGHSAGTNTTPNPEHIARRRRHSLAETEPAPHLPNFSPPISQQQQRRNASQTSYHEQRAELRRTSGRESSQRKSPRLGFAAAVMDGASSTSRTHMPFPDMPRSDKPNSPFNSIAPSFRPQSGDSSSLDYNSGKNNIAFSNVGSQFSRPPANQFYSQPNHGFMTEAPEMGRTTSGGIMVGGRYVQFGDYPVSNALFDTFPSRDGERERDRRPINTQWGSRSQEGWNRVDWEKEVSGMPRASSGRDLSRYVFGAASASTRAVTGGDRDRERERDRRDHGVDTYMTGTGTGLGIDTRRLSNPERTMLGSRPGSASASGSGSGSGSAVGFGSAFDAQMNASGFGSDTASGFGSAFDARMNRGNGSGNDSGRNRDRTEYGYIKRRS